MRKSSCGTNPITPSIFSFSLWISMPLMRTFPSEGVSVPFNTFINVDFPDPLAPITPTSLPPSSDILIFLSPMPKVMVRVVPGMTKEAIEDVHAAWNTVYAGEPFDYNFIDENLKEQYTAENNFGRIMSSATILAVIIGSLGLFGLSTLTMNARLREVSIRKVLGASGNNLLITLNKSFVIFIVIAFVIASPFTYYAMDDWLSEFQYKIEITPWLFVAAGVLTIIISLITVSYQTIQAIRTNPANILRTE